MGSLCVKTSLSTLYILICLCVSVCAVNHDYSRNTCTQGDTERVQQEWNAAFSASDGGRRRIILVNQMFFAMTQTPAFQAHMYRLIVDLNLIISALHNEESLKAQLRHLAYKRNKYMGAHVNYFKALTRVLMNVLPRISQRFSSAAWEACLSHVGHYMTSSRVTSTSSPPTQPDD